MLRANNIRSVNVPLEQNARLRLLLAYYVTHFYRNSLRRKGIYDLHLDLGDNLFMPEANILSNEMNEFKQLMIYCHDNGRIDSNTGVLYNVGLPEGIGGLGRPQGHQFRMR